MTAGNASGINDGAAAVVLAEARGRSGLGLKPMARLVGYAHAGVDPPSTGHWPHPGDAMRRSPRPRRLMSPGLDVIELNEAFAAQACAVPASSVSTRPR